MKTTIIGVGAMGGAIVEGLLKCPNIPPSDITISDPCEAAINRFAHTGISLTTDNATAAKDSHLVIVVVKPWLVESVLEEIRESLNLNEQVIVVIAAGVSSKDIARWLDNGNGDRPRLLLAIPNTAIAVKESMTFLVPAGATADDTQMVEGLFSQLGRCIVTEERLLPAGTTLASCGIAYAMRYVRAAVEGGVEIGFKAHDAEDIVLQTVKGAVSLLQATGEHPEAAIDKVTTPGGVTIKGLNEMEHAGFTSAVVRGIKAGMGK
ncbi:MAG: pyrroline-5-carboxylate reductase [Prevotella sp.]|jgi:pyrroline-5-carboxylate reductase|nr:pyrroline-5-carboxylate reductase [Prevotella sp.]